MGIAARVIEDIRGQVKLAPHGKKREVVEEIAKTIINPNTGEPYSVAQIYRFIDVTAGVKKSAREHEIPSETIDKIAAIKIESGKMGVKKRFITTEDAIDLLEQAGEIEPGSITVATADRRMREAGISKQRGYERHEDDFVNQVHHIDFSRAEYFDAGLNKEGEAVIKVDGRKGVWDYKNKEKAERKRLWVMGYIDSKSRAYLVRYFESTGETLQMGTEALEFAWQRRDEIHPLVHTPQVLKFDQGSFGKFLKHHKTFERDTGVRIELAGSKSDRYADHQSQGKIERPFRVLWQKFELKLAMILKKKGIAEISLEELNTLAHNYCVELLTKKHPVRNQSRGEVYRTGIRMREQNVLTTSIWDLLFRESTRKVGADRMVSYKGIFYRVPGEFRRQRIYVMESTDGRITGQDLERHHSFDLVAFNPDEATGTRVHEETYSEKIAREDSSLDGSKLRLVGSTSGAILPHTLPPIEIEKNPNSPFNAQPVKEPFASWAEAKMFVCEVFSCRWDVLDSGTQEALERMFTAEALDKEVVRDLYKSVS